MMYDQVKKDVEVFQVTYLLHVTRMSYQYSTPKILSCPQGQSNLVVGTSMVDRFFD